MRRRQLPDPYATAATPRFIVRQDMQRQVLEIEALAPRTELRSAMAAAIGKLERDGWTAESDAKWGFVFLRRAGERCLLLLTERDPADETMQSFNPHR